MAYKTINVKGELLDLSRPIVMGILNITPDSFYKNSRKQTEKDIVKRSEQIICEGGTIIDIGGQSSNPISFLLSVDEELDRLRPALSLINREFPEALVSVDTFYSQVAKVCVEEYGVALVNDISGGEIDKKMFETVAGLNVPYVLMHMRGTPQTMSELTDYDNMLQDIFYYFSEKIALLHQLGVKDVIVDPGFGFSKTLNQNYELMAALRGFAVFESPILAGISRKSMIYNLTGTNPENSLNGTSVLNTFAIQNGANILRVHDVKAATEVIQIMDKLNEYKF